MPIYVLQSNRSKTDTRLFAQTFSACTLYAHDVTN